MTDRQSGFWGRSAQWLRRLLSDQQGNRQPWGQSLPTVPCPSTSILPFPQSLEPRIYYDASPLGALLSPPALDVADSAVNAELATPDQFEFPEAMATAELTAPAIDLRLHSVSSGETQSSSVSEVIFVDGGIADFEQLWQAITSDQQAGVLDGSVVVHRLDASSDGVSQITEVLSQYSGLSAVHLLVHGSSGQLQLGDVVLTQESLRGYAGEVALWQNALASEADLLIYGCRLADSDSGMELIEQLQALTGADVAASDDLTGHATLGGDWDLEFQDGTIESQSIFTVTAPGQWFGLLDLTAAGNEVLANGNAASGQFLATDVGQNIAMDASGRFVVSWHDDRSGNFDVYARVFNADGTARTGEFLVHSVQSTPQDYSNVAMADNGNFIVTWSDARSGVYEVYMRLYDINGNALTGETLVSTLTNSQDFNSADFAADGSFVITFYSTHDSNIYFQRFSAAGAVVGGNTVVNNLTTGNQELADIAVRNDGSFIVTWSDDTNDASGRGVYARMFNSSGVALANQFLVNSNTTGNQHYSSIDSDDSGNFVISWTSASQDGSGEGIYLKRYNASGVAQTGDILVNTITSNEQRFSHVDMNAVGDFVVVWEDNANDSGGSGIFAQQFDRNGTRLGGQVSVNSTSTGNQTTPSVAYHGSSVVVSWVGNGVGDGQGVFFRRFSATDYSTLTVTSTSNTIDGDTSSIAALLNNRGADGQISLREAIAAVNNSVNGFGGADRIHFSIGSGNQTISVTGTDLAEFSDAVILDGTTQSGFSSAPLISIVDGDTRTFGIKLWSGSSGSTIRGLNIQGFGTAGISIATSNNLIVGNWIGTNAAGTAAAGNYDGITIWDGDNNIIGGTTAADRNVISGNTNNGLSGSGGANGTQILGNYFGTDKDGLALVANTVHGIWYGDSTGIVVGGNASNRRNIVASDGFGVEFSNTDNSFIQGNYIGLAADGSTILGNDWSGIILSNGASGNLIGTNADGANDTAERNVISGNYVGVLIQGSGTTANIVAGNLIGTDATGSLNRGNTHDGIRIELSAAGNTIGGTATGAGNTIAFNGRDGIRIDSTAGTGNAILTNQIYSNTGLGINLVGGSENGFGVTTNDSGDSDTGANNLQNFPVITSAGAGASSLQVQGSLGGVVGRTHRIEVFASSAADASGHGEGQRYLGSFNVTIDVTGSVAFNQTLAGVSVAVGELVTMTATDLTTNDTSEFAAAVAAIFLNSAPTALATNTTRRGGLVINDGSGNDSYLIADNGSNIFGGRTQFTLEFQFALSTANMQHTFLSYAVSGMDNEVYLRTGADGSLSLSVKGTSVTSSAINFNSLVGAGLQTLTVTWNNATGAWQFFLNGTSFATGTGLQTGATLASGGALVVGHDQDSVAGGFQSAQALKGTLFDVRVFNDVRTQAEISSAYQTTLPFNTSGLVANWTFDDLSSNGKVTDTVTGNNLTVQHASGAGFVADVPYLTLAVDENSITGSVVGSIYGTDPDREARITALLAADATLRYSAETGKFYKLINATSTWSSALTTATATTLNGVTGQMVTIRSAEENRLILSFSQEMSASIWLGATDVAVDGTWRWYLGGSASDQFWNGTATGYRVDGVYTNWASGEPSNSSAGAEDFGYLQMDGTWNDAVGTLTLKQVVEWNADDVLDASHAVTYTITSQTVSGAFAINSDSGIITVANQNLLNFESQPTHTVTVRVTDGNGAFFDKALTISLNNVAVEPSNSVPTAQTTNEDTNLVFSTTNGNAITVTDQNGSTNALLQVSLSVPSGTLTLSQTTGLSIVGGSNGSGGMVIVGTESDINAALNGLTFAPASNFNGSVNLSIETALAANMEGWYTFEGGNANDQSVGVSQNGTFVGNATTVTDATRGTVLTLDGNGDSVSINSTFGNPTNVTIGGWVNLNSSAGRAEFISLHDRVHIALDETGGGIKGSIQTGVGSWLDLTSQRFIAGTGWHHVMYVFDDVNDVHNLYVDGQLAATAVNTNSIYWTGATTSYIGQHPTNTAWNLNGKVDDVRVYIRALSAAEVATLAREQVVDSDVVAITVNPVNDAPVLDNTGTMTLTTINENQTNNSGQTVASIIASATGDRITDVDSGAVEGIAITALSSGNGTWEYSTNGLNWTAIGTVSNTSALLLRSTDFVRFVPNGDDGTTASFTFRAWDQTDTTLGQEGTKVDTSTNGGTTPYSASTEVAAITVTAVNDVPVIAGLDGDVRSYSEGSAAVLVGSTSGITDVDSADFNSGTLTVSFTSGSDSTEDVLGIRNEGTGAGQIGVSGFNVTYGGVVIGTWSGGSSGTNLVITLNSNANATNVAALINNLTYFNSDDANPTTTTRGIRIVLTDGDGGTSANNDTTMSVSVVNDAPVLDNSGTMTLTTITENDTNNSGQTVASIIASALGDRITDVDNVAVEGIAITSLNSGNGTWQFSINNGSSWNDVGVVSGSSALLLRSTDLIRFVPNGIAATSADFTFRAWDQTGATAGQEGTKVDVSANGGSTPFSTATETAAITVTEVNDEQILATNTGLTVTENSTGNTLANTVLLTSDVDHASNQLVYTITSATANGTLRRSGTALTVGGTFTQADINAGLITYDHNGSETASDSFSFSVDDGAGSGSTGTFNFTITPVNDNSPTITSNGGGSTASLNVAENSTAVTTVTATDGDLPGQTLTYSITGGADAGLFLIDSNTGVLTFVSGRNRESHTDADLNGIYEVTVQVTDGNLIDTQAISVTITDVDEFDVTPPADVNATANAVSENAVTGTVVGITAAASDADATNNSIVYSLTDSAGGRFTIDANSGVVTVADGSLLNREAAAAHNITVRATSLDGSIAETVFTINISDIDEFDVGAITDTNASANSVAENAIVGTAVGITALASDADATTNAITYALDDNAGGRFAIDAATGVVTVNAALDFESQTSHSITIRATSADGSFATQIFTIQVTDVNEGAIGPVADSNVSANFVWENSGNGTVVGVTGLATDPDGTDTVTYSLDDDANGRFTIDASTGVVTVAGAIDRETASSYDIIIRATSSDLSFATQSFTISIGDVDEFDSSAISDANAGVNQVAENASVGATVGITAAAVDNDASASVTYTLDNDAGGLFAIDANSGVVTVAAGLDYESATSHLITIRATSTDGSFTTQDFTVNVLDVNETAVSSISDTNAAADFVLENAVVGATVGVTAFASDADGTDTVSYSLDNDASGLFTIDGNTGLVTVAGAINREVVGATLTITVRATSTDGSFSTRDFTINVGDVDEFDTSAISDANAGVNQVAENASVGATVGITAAAVDNDATASVTYTLDNDAGGLFAIDANSGVVTVAGGLDYETATSHLITVRATSTDGSFTTQDFTINVLDVNENAVSSISDTDAAADFVLENAVVGATVGVTAFASDADGTDTVSYSLDNDASGLFTIDGNTGLVTVAGAINREVVGATLTITVRATSTDGSFSTRDFTINVGDVDEFDTSAISDVNAGVNQVAESASVGATVGITAAAVDNDATASVTYSLANDAGGLFAIDANSGIVTVAGGLDYETATSHLITVRATSTDGSFTTQDFTINVLDVNETAVTPISDTNAAADFVLENAVVGATVGVTAFASDADGTDTVSYSLDNDASGLFTIDGNTGLVTVAGAINREAVGATLTITVRATSTDGSFSTRDFTINVGDVDEFDTSAISDVNAGVNQVAESASVGATVGITAAAVDNDATASVTYTLDNNAGGLFAIDANSGVVTVAGGLDYETATSHLITIRATSTDGSFTTQDFTINVLDVNENAVSSISDTDATADFVLENAVVGATVGVTAFASDADGTDTVSYSLDSDASGLFTIDGNTGLVTVAGAINREAVGATLTITVRATSTDGSFSTRDFTINVGDVDEFDTSAISDVNAGLNQVAESASVGATVGITAAASDNDATASVTYTLDNDAGGLFAIDANSGVVTVAGGLDYETATSHLITVRATSTDGSFTTQDFTINVLDVNENAVSLISDTNAAADFVLENAVVGATVGVTAFASDADGTDTVSYSLDNDASGLFAIDGNTGLVTVAGAINREVVGATLTITVRATSTDGSFSTRDFTINVGDIDEFDTSAISDANAGVNQVAENANVGATVGITASATDNDATASVTYSLDNDAGGLFAIDANSGVVTVAGGLDYETATSHLITIRATSTDGSFTTQDFTINVLDVNETAVTPISDTNAAADFVLENAVVGATVGVSAFASDADGTDTVSYSLDNDASGLFTIDGNTGLVTVAGAINREVVGATLTITVRATSTDGSFSTRDFTINVGDVDEFDTSAISDVNAGANQVAENVSVGATVGITAAAVDNDATASVTYSLDNDAGGLFAIDANSGVVTVAGGLDYETATSHLITVRATSTDGSFTTQNFTINVLDVNETAITPISDTDAAADFVLENAVVGATVGVTAFASDADGTDIVSYSLDNDANGLFAIDGNTGLVTVAGAINREVVGATLTITVRATSTDGSFSTRDFTINVGDVDEFDTSAISDANAGVNQVAENASVGATVGITASATDNDATASVTYTLDNDAGGMFAIDANSGVVTVAGGLDYESATSHLITVRATSTDGSFTTQDFTINVLDVNETAVTPISDTNAAADFVLENAVVGATVGVTAFASDADGTDTVAYSLDNDASGLFTIDGNTGLVTVAGAINREAVGATLTITVRATSTDGSFSTRDFTISIGDVDEFDTSALSDANAGVNQVAENASVGATVGITASATDNDATASVTYTLDNDAGGLFAIDANSGVVTVAGGLDYETATSHLITVRATSTDGSFTTQDFTINVLDVNETAVTPISDTNAAADFVLENAVVGATVGVTAFASDADGTDTVYYSLDNDASGLFTIDGNTGLVTVAGAINREVVGATLTITVRATSTDGSFSTRDYTINVGDVDEFDTSAISDVNAGVNQVAESASVGATVGITAAAVDNDATASVTYTLDNDAGGLFAIDANSGVVTVAGGLDYETATSHLITVRATSTDGSFTTQDFTINVLDVNENAVSSISDTNAAADFVLENTVVGATVGVTAFASDADGTDTVSYSLDNDASGLFTIDGNTGLVTVAGAINREAVGGTLTITVRATSTDGSFSTRDFTISIGDVDEFDTSAISDVDASANQIDENASVGTTVGVTAQAVDPDATSQVTYSLIDDANGRFSIDPVTGVVYLQGSLDFETQTACQISVRAQSSDGSWATQDFTIAVADVNESTVTPIVNVEGIQPQVRMQSAPGATVGLTAFAIDADGTDSVNYQLLDDAGGMFTIDAQNGTVTLVGSPINQLQLNYRIIVQATSSDGSQVQQSFDILLIDPPAAAGPNPSTTPEISQPVEPELDPDLGEDPAFESGAPNAAVPILVPPPLLPETTKPGESNSAIGAGPADGGDAPAGEVAQPLSEKIWAMMTSTTSNELEFMEFTSLSQNVIEEIDELAGLNVVTTANWDLESLRIWREFRDLERSILDRTDELTIGGVNLNVSNLTLAVSFGALLWYLRSGVLMATLLTQLPTWKLIDPLLVLESFDSQPLADRSLDDVNQYFDQRT